MIDGAPIFSLPDLSSAVLNLCFILPNEAFSATLSIASSERFFPRNLFTCTTAPLRSCYVVERKCKIYHVLLGIVYQNLEINLYAEEVCPTNKNAV